MTTVTKQIAQAALAQNTCGTALASALDAMSKSNATNAAFYSAAYSASQIVALLACIKVGKAWRKGDDKATAKGAWSDIWTMTLKEWAIKGNMIYRDTENFVATLRATPSRDGKIAVVNSYIGQKGLNVTEPVAKVRKLARLIVDDMVTNDSEFVRALPTYNDDMARMTAFADRVAERYGKSYAKAEDYFRSDKPSKATDPIESMIGKIEKVGDIAAIEKLLAAVTARKAELEMVSAMHATLPDADETDATDETPEAIAA